MSDHTPLPWFAVNVGTAKEPMWSIKAARIAGKPPRHEVAICATGDSTQEMETANAAFIVKSVNAYADLVAALKGLLIAAPMDNAKQAAVDALRKAGAL